MLIPHYVQPATSVNDAELLSIFNFCSAADVVFPFPDSEVSPLDMQHLWGLYIGIPVYVPPTPTTPSGNKRTTGFASKNRSLSACGANRSTSFRNKNRRIL